MNRNLGLRKLLNYFTGDDGKIWTGKRKIGIGVRPNEKTYGKCHMGV